MSKFTIIIKGVAANYMKDEAWKVLFPFNDCHTVKLRIGDEPDDPQKNTRADEGISLAQQGLRIDISVTDPLTRTAEGDDYSNFLDLTGDGVHDALMPQFNMGEMNAVMMSIESAQFSVHDHTENNWRLVDRDDTTGGTTDFQKTGNCGKAYIEGGELTIQVTGPETSFNMSFTEDATIVFDNDCQLETENLEFGEIDMLYAILRDADEGSRKFKLEKDPSQVLVIERTPASRITRNNGIAVVERPATPESPTGNLPCNEFRISRTLHLPS